MRLKSAFGIALVSFIYLAGTIIFFGFGLDSKSSIFSSFPILYSMFFGLPLLILLLTYRRSFSSMAAQLFVLLIILLVSGSALLFSSNLQKYYEAGAETSKTANQLANEINSLNGKSEQLNARISSMISLTKQFAESNVNLTNRLLALQKSKGTPTTIPRTTRPTTTRQTTVPPTTIPRDEEEYDD